jgi:hypothetical protein
MIKPKNQILFLLVLLTISLAFSCNKEDDEDIPKVTFQYPNENASYVVGDTITVKVVIESNSPIKSVHFSLVNDDLNPVITNYHYPLNVVSGTAIIYSFPIDNMRLESGKYKISCIVSNQSETKHKYIDVLVSALDRVLKDVAIVTRKNSHIKVYSIGPDMNKTPELLFNVNSDYSASCYLPLNERFALGGSVIGDVTVWNYFTKDTLQVIKVQANPPFPYFSTLSSVGNYLAVGYYQESVSLYNSFGDKKNDIITKTGYFPDMIIDVGDNYYIEESEKSGNRYYISVFDKQSNSYYSSYSVNGKLIGSFPFDGNDAIIFFNIGNTGNIEKYIYDDNATTEPVYYGGDKIISTAQIDSKNYLIASEDELLWYQYHISSVTPILSNRHFDNLNYEELSKTVILNENMAVKRISIPDGQIVGNVQMGEEILDIHLIYNY